MSRSPFRKLPSSRFTVALAIGATLALAGCSKAPQKEIDAAQAALEKAKASGADAYAADAYHGAEEAMAQARAEVEAQKGKFRLMQSYGKAKLLLVKAEADAEQALLAAEEGKIQFRQDSQIAIDAARTRLDAAVAAVANAPAGKDARADVEAMKGDLEALRATLAEAEAAYGGEDFATAKQKAEQVQREAEAIAADVARAIEKVNRA